MSWIHILPALVACDILLYAYTWEKFARRYYYLDYLPTRGFRMAWTLQKSS